MAGPDCRTLRREADEAYSNKEWERAAAAYVELSDACPDLLDKWDWYKCGQSLRRIGEVSKAMEVARWLVAEFEDFVQARSLMAWCLFDTEIKLSPEQVQKQESRFIAAAQRIVELTGDDKYSVYVPFVRTARRMVDFLTSGFRQNADEDVLQWLDEMEPDKLSTEVRRYTNAAGRQIAIASDQEWWYNERSKALLSLERFQECFDVCERALASVTEFRDGDLWFRRRRALCLAQLGQVDQAIADLEEIRQEREDWFVDMDLARILHEAGRSEEALRYATAGALEGPIEPHRWRLYVLLASLYRGLGKEDVARDHATLALRAHDMEPNWPFGARQEEVQKEFGVVLDGAPTERDLARKLQPLWMEIALQAMPRGEGLIQNFRTGDDHGYIERREGGPLYFQLKDWKGAPELLAPGAGVRFLVARRHDRDHHVTEQAIEVTPLA